MRTPRLGLWGPPCPKTEELKAKNKKIMKKKKRLTFWEDRPIQGEGVGGVERSRSNKKTETKPKKTINIIQSQCKVLAKFLETWKKIE